MEGGRLDRSKEPAVIYTGLPETRAENGFDHYCWRPLRRSWEGPLKGTGCGSLGESNLGDRPCREHRVREGRFPA